MNKTEFQQIERQLDVVLPEIFRKFISEFPSKTTNVLRNEVSQLPTDGELFIVKQLQFFSSGINLYESQPELKSRRFIYIGDDGCGNFYCMTGDDPSSDQLWIWEHDPPDGFSQNGSLEKYFQKDKWILATVPDPYSEMKGLFLCRSVHPLLAATKPITMDEWLQYVDQSPVLELDESHIGKNPFTKEEVVFRMWPGRAKLLIDDKARHVSYQDGMLSFGKRVAASVKEQAGIIASDLLANTWTSSK